MLKHTTILSSILLLGLCGCAANTRKQMEQQGGVVLVAEELYTLASDHTMQITAGDFNGRVRFYPDSRLAARSRLGETDQGKWDITTDNRLCLEYDKWFFGDRKCYTLIEDREHGGYVFFTSNGARYAVGELQAGNPADVAVRSTAKPTSYLAQKISGQRVEPIQQETPASATPQPIQGPPPSQEEMKHHLAMTARNCPDCNLSGADLRGTNLITANLAGADLSGANLSGADLSGANLPGAILTNCDLTGADFSRANLVAADLTGARRDNTIFTNSHLEAAKGLQ